MVGQKTLKEEQNYEWRKLCNLHCYRDFERQYIKPHKVGFGISHNYDGQLVDEK